MISTSTSLCRGGERRSSTSITCGKRPGFNKADGALWEAPIGASGLLGILLGREGGDDPDREVAVPIPLDLVDRPQSGPLNTAQLGADTLQALFDRVRFRRLVRHRRSFLPTDRVGMNQFS